MGRTTVTRTINASTERVFDTIAHIENYSKAVPEIVKVELLSETKRGAGTRFRETRKMGKREVASVLEVREYAPHQRVRMVSDQGGTVWDTVFSIEPSADNAVELKMVMDANAYKLMAKIFNPMIKGMIKKFIEKDMDAVKAYCEDSAGR